MKELDDLVAEVAAIKSAVSDIGTAVSNEITRVVDSIGQLKAQLAEGGPYAVTPESLEEMAQGLAASASTLEGLKSQLDGVQAPAQDPAPSDPPADPAPDPTPAAS